MTSRPSRRGQIELLVNISRVIAIAILVFLLNVQLGFFINEDFSTDELQARLITQRLLNSLTPEPGTLDMSQFTSRHVTDAYLEGFGDENFWGGRLSLYHNVEDLKKKTSSNVIYLGEGSAAVDLLPLAAAGVRGRGAGKYYARTYPLLLDGELVWLDIELVRRT